MEILSKCAVCCWVWEETDSEWHCRLCQDPETCEGPIGCEKNHEENKDG